MSGRSKCTAGGDEASTKRSGEMGSHASHKHIADIESRILSDSHTHTHAYTSIIACLRDPANIIPRNEMLFN